MSPEPSGVETPQPQPTAVETPHGETRPSAEPEPVPTMEPPSPPQPVITLPEAERPSAAAPVGADQSVFKGPIPEIVLYTGDRQLGVFSLAQGELTIGRTPGNSIMIDNLGVSRRHAVIRVVDGRAVIEDLGSANGTSIGGERISSRELKDGDEISVVKHRLVFRVPKGAETVPKTEPVADAGQKTMFIDQGAIAHAMAARPTPRGEGATPVLRPCLILPDLKKFALESEEITLGSGRDCQIQLSGIFVNRAHARIIPQKDGQYKIVHLAGFAGTWVNGEKISVHTLRHGDEIEIGKQRILFRLER
jgi:pSer/pThr/pTyr-binding forkhead associated (FHA) protein